MGQHECNHFVTLPPSYPSALFPLSNMPLKCGTQDLIRGPKCFLSSTDLLTGVVQWRLSSPPDAGSHPKSSLIIDPFWAWGAQL